MDAEKLIALASKAEAIQVYGYQREDDLCALQGAVDQLVDIVTEALRALAAKGGEP